MRRLLAAFAALLCFSAPALAQKTKAALTTEINTNWPDNSTGAITPALLRSTVTDIVNSYFDLNGGSSLGCASHNWISALPTLSSLTCTQPLFSDIANTPTTLSGYGITNGLVNSNNLSDLTNVSAALLNLGIGTLGLQAANNVNITGGTINGAAVTGLATPTGSTDAANKAYVDANATGLTIHSPVAYATAAVLPNTPTYDNGAGTLTSATQSVLVVDGQNITTQYQRILVKDQATGYQNGCYTLTTVGVGGSAAWVLTRCTDMNTTGVYVGAYFLVNVGGSANPSGFSFVQTTTGTITLGTTAMVFTQFAAVAPSVTSVGALVGVITLGTGLTTSSNSILVGSPLPSSLTIPSPNLTGTPEIAGVSYTWPATSTLLGSGINNTLGTGAGSTTNLTSANTGFASALGVTNTGTTSNAATNANLFASLGSTLGATLGVTGGATPAGSLAFGAGLTGGATISTGAGNLNLSPPAGKAVVVTQGFTATGLVTLVDLATQTANTVLGNATGSTAPPTALTMPSCSTVSSGLTWTTSTGFGCNTALGGIFFNVNNYASLALALTAASGKGYVYIPGGTTVSISSAVTCPANTGIRGDGPSSIISVTTASSVGINIPNAGCTLKDFDINYSSAGTAGGYGIYITNTAADAPLIDHVNISQPYYGLYFNGANFAYARNLNVKNATSIGVDIASSPNIILTNVSAANTSVNAYTSNASLYMFGAATSGCVIDGGEWYGASGYALFYSTAGVGNLIKNAFFDSGSTGSVISSAAQLSIIGNWFSGGRVAPYYNGLLVSGGSSIIISGNIFAGSGLDGLLINTASFVTITGNIANGNGIGNGSGNTTKNGIEVNTGSGAITVTNNIATGNTNYGLIFDGAASAYIITGNQTTGNTQAIGISPPSSGTFYGPGLVGSGTSANF